MSYETDMTIEYYEENTARFELDTIGADMSEIREKFMAYLPNGGKILDFGCGTGRDALAFSDLGYDVIALDGSASLCKVAREHTRLSVICCIFQDYEADGQFDGIWACASLLHLKKEELQDVLMKLMKSLKPNGVLYMSFKSGTFSGERNGRWFTDMTEESLKAQVDCIDSLTVKDSWVSDDVREKQQGQKWINMIARKEVTQGDI